MIIFVSRKVTSIFVVIALMIAPAMAEFHTWKSTAGTAIDAKLVRQDGNSVILEKRDGGRVTVRADLLDRDTRLLLKKVGESSEEKPGKPSKTFLPGLDKGEWEGRHAIYEETAFEAILRKQGHLFIHLKRDGRRIPGLQPIIVKPEFHVRGDTGWFQREVVTLTTAGLPRKQPSELSYVGLTDDGVTFEQHFSFKGNRIKAWGACQDPVDSKHVTDFRVRVQFVRTHVLEDHQAQAEVEAAVAGSQLVIEAGKSGKTNYSFAEPLTLQSAPANKDVRVLIVRPNSWQGLRMEVTSPRLKYGTLQVWNYAEKPLYQGFSASFHKATASEKSKQAAVELVIR